MMQRWVIEVVDQPGLDLDFGHIAKEVDYCIEILVVVAVLPGIDACMPLPWNREQHRPTCQERYRAIADREHRCD
jgi:hypothetical protein